MRGSPVTLLVVFVHSSNLSAFFQPLFAVEPVDEYARLLTGGFATPFDLSQTGYTVQSGTNESSKPLGISVFRSRRQLA